MRDTAGMFTPGILAKHTHWIREAAITVVDRVWAAPAEYERLVEGEWRRLRDGPRRLWDGTYYRVENPDQLGDGTKGRLTLGTIRYRYIATYPALHEEHARCGLEALHHLSTVGLIRTSDGQYLFGRRTANGAVDLIGGGVQQDEIRVETGMDLERNLLKEIHEETGIEAADVSLISYPGVLLSGTSNVIVAAYVRLRIRRRDVEARFDERTEDEMAEPVFVAEDAVRGVLEEMGDYRRQLLKLSCERSY